MRTILKIVVTFFIFAIITSCSSENPIMQSETNPPSTDSSLQLPTKSGTINYLALGDSYTIGESVCETCRFPEQLKKALKNLNEQNNFALEIIAQTGWTTTNLISAIESKNPSPKYDLVTLLIGVNNQYQNKVFSLYEKEFPELVTKAISLAKGDKNKLIVVSIPDYAYTPFGQGSSNPATISTEIDRYNTFAKSYCEANAITYVNITDITRQGLSNTSLVASDGLHPSTDAYALFVQRLLPKAVAILQK
ncbi:SGNH/GDSL hydrolase family protein [Flavobacterium sufflavum]|uniref:SGNH/GDSL hydrolase family protein n=1 Tax=Flavobacterium sufflavum TaxID=1921138 RepID=A0A3S2UMM0_9FLAO|nr:SGNH/GDSL hydrolase family protein [Flavobacterium sufflavum]RVT79600.1 SGNH/GDSL hydrolase family protein [Flavobacterium sufflavum]